MNLLAIKQNLNAKNIALVHVVAFDQEHCIGKDNQLAWHVPEDLQHFKAITTGGVIVMGRKNFDSMGRALPNRTNSGDYTRQDVDGGRRENRPQPRRRPTLGK